MGRKWRILTRFHPEQSAAIAYALVARACEAWSRIDHLQPGFLQLLQELALRRSSPTMRGGRYTVPARPGAEHMKYLHSCRGLLYMEKQKS